MINEIKKSILSGIMISIGGAVYLSCVFKSLYTTRPNPMDAHLESIIVILKSGYSSKIVSFAKLR